MITTMENERVLFDNSQADKEVVPLRRNHIVFFSGGKASLAAADHVKKMYPDDNILLYFTDTLWEHSDLYRFLDEGSDTLELPLLIHCAGITPIQLMFEKKLVYNNMIGDCSKLLKMRVASDFLKKGIEPNIVKWRNQHLLKQDDFITDATLYFGIGIEEMHREKGIVENWKPFSVEMPLIENHIRPNEVLQRYGIREPELYKLGFAHNNCFGRCVKAGKGHYRHLKKTLPDVFRKHMEQEFHLSMCVSAYRYIIDDNVPEEDRIPADVQERMLQELDNAYRDYFYDRANKPKLYIHPAGSAVEKYMKVRQYSFMKRKSDKPVVFEYSGSDALKADGDTLALDFGDDGGSSVKGLRYPSVPYLLRDFSLDEDVKPEQIDLFDIGGCGCFVQFEEDSSSACSV
ncbi:phosphoadenosine phosphosulfate reductase family protein [Paenibacillus sp. Y412MC10]|uniref:phosphoadenosine phosphosulfate reductase domain-containing protein n=1 Tax=Geobacillus sp. (strain Y412MC10) TaxID=481743 RepID=UPI0021B49D74|nr:phosphoadenosine phosphosulfate reductase family protein [Paenibacillus sp. Y412MC10]